MDFIPDQPKKNIDVPYFEDVTGDAGWQGQTTGKSVETLKSEITSAVSRLGGLVSGFQKGLFQVGNRKRQGFRIFYTLSSEDKMIPGRLDIAALPTKDDYRIRRSKSKRDEQSLKMALFMMRNALDGLWFLQQLSPGYAPLMPFMMTKDGKTISQLWSESAVMGNLLPPGESDFVEGEVKQL